MIENDAYRRSKRLTADELSRNVEHMRERRAKLESAPKPSEAECCAGCQYPRLCEGCALLRDATDGRR